MRENFRRAAAQAAALYHRKMREAYVARQLKVDNDGIVQFVIAGYEVERANVARMLGYIPKGRLSA